MDGHFSPSPGEYESINCDTCNTKMDVIRGVYGPTSSIEAMARRKHLHDSFICSHRGEMWHIQVDRLQLLATKTPSKTFEIMLLAEVDGILRTRVETKEVSKYDW